MFDVLQHYYDERRSPKSCSSLRMSELTALLLPTHNIYNSTTIKWENVICRAFKKAMIRECCVHNFSVASKWLKNR